jgi:hypothetical protein
MWWWVGYGGFDYDLRVPTAKEEETLGTQFQHDRRHLDNVILKTNVRWKNHLMEVMFLGNLHDRQGFQAEFERPPETTYHQREWTPLVKWQDEWLVSPDLHVSAKVGWYSTRHKLFPAGGIDRPARLDERTDIWRDSYRWQDLHTRSWSVQLQSIAYRLHALGVRHEVKLGLEFQNTDARLGEGFANGLVFAYEDIREPKGGGEIWLVREGHTRAYLGRGSGYVQDTITWGRWSALLGLRLDVQWNGLRASSTPAHPWRPDWLPGGNTKGRTMGFTWTTLSPRVGVGYDFRGNGRTVLRSTFALYPSALGVSEPLSMSPTGRRELRFRWLGRRKR